jgi:hypothetical protein
LVDLNDPPTAVGGIFAFCAKRSVRVQCTGFNVAPNGANTTYRIEAINMLPPEQPKSGSLERARISYSLRP